MYFGLTFVSLNYMRLIITVFCFFAFQFLVGQQQDKIDFLHGNITIELVPEKKQVKGFVHYSFKVVQDVDSVFLDAKNMDIDKINLNSLPIGYKYDQKRITIKKQFKKGAHHQLAITYSCLPKQTVYFIGFDDAIEGNEQLWTQGQGKYTSHWLPSFDDMNEKLEFDLTFTNLPERFNVIANGKRDAVSSDHQGGLMTKFDMKYPMSSYLVAFAAGDFQKKELRSGSGIPISLYYEPKDSLKVEPTYRYTKRIFDFLEAEIGVDYPWQNYKQVPVQDFLYAGMENTGTTLFSNGYMIDSIAFVDKNYVNVNAHELAHQWFGNLVTEESSEHHWLHEGFATYYAYLAEKQLFGEDHFYWKLFQTAKTLHNVSENEGGEALTNPNANSLTFYEKGAWALVMLKDLIGEGPFKEGVKAYLNKHAFKNVTILDFLKALEIPSNQDLTGFREKWLESDVFPWEEVKEKLQRESESIRLVFQMEEAFKNEGSDDLDYDAYWEASESSNFKVYLIQQYHQLVPKTVLDKAFSSNDIKIRQALATSLYGISETRLDDTGLAAQFETLLGDESYITVENALIRLWSLFPEKRTEYLDKTSTILGLPNKNIRLLWLILAIITPEYQPNLRNSNYLRLNEFTLPENHFETRQLAFQYLSDTSVLNEDALQSLLKATKHHVWQFKKSSRVLFKELYRLEHYKTKLDKLMTALPTKEKETLIKILEK